MVERHCAFAPRLPATTSPRYLLALALSIGVAFLLYDDPSRWWAYCLGMATAAALLAGEFTLWLTSLGLVVAGLLFAVKSAAAVAVIVAATLIAAVAQKLCRPSWTELQGRSADR